MRTKAEIERAIQHIREAVPPPGNADSFYLTMNAIVVDVLRWAAGEETPFSTMVNSCDAVDAAERVN